MVIVVILLLNSIINGSKPPADLTLQFWGTFDDPTYYEQIIREYKRSNTNVTIIYRQVPFSEYEQDLISAFAAGSGPDIWLMHNTWLPKHQDLIAPLPQPSKNPLFTFKQFQERFVDVAVSDLTRGTDVYALPTYVDSLALYYNKDLFNTVGISGPPRTWEDFVRDVKILTTKDDKGNILVSAAAMGTARNINRSTDLLGLLMLQSGTRMTNSGNTSATFAQPVDGINTGELSLQFYTDFANAGKPDRYTWNDQEKYSIDAFADGNTAMMFNYSHHISTLRQKSPRLNFGIAPVPQPAQSTVSVNFANYWAPTVSKQSKNIDAAWKFLTYLATTDATKQYLNASSRPAARRDLIDIQRTDADLGTFATENLTARSWYEADNTPIESIFADMIDDVNFSRANVHDALGSAQNKVNVLMQRNR